jgi:TIR domain-containing protein/SIR2-like protein
LGHRLFGSRFVFELAQLPCFRPWGRYPATRHLQEIVRGSKILLKLSDSPSAMTAATLNSAALNSAAWDETEWDRLLLLVERGTVIPIVGAELSLHCVSPDGQSLLMNLARQLAARLRVSAEALPSDAPLNEIACRLVASGSSLQDLYVELYQLLQTSPLPPSEPLQQLAQITDFQILITTTFDTSLEAAIREARSVEALSLSYAPNDIQDLPGPRKALTQPVIYHLLGRADVSPSYALTEEDKLEFFHAIQSPQRRPERLFAELSASNVMILGGSYTDWLARFFLRSVKVGRRLSDQRPVREFIADREVAADLGFVLFLQQYSKPTRLYPDGDPIGFVAELHRRWCKRNPGKLRSFEVVAGSPAIERPPSEMPNHAIFISYAREDTAAVRELFTGLKTRGLKVWFDFDRLEAGDEYEMKIKRSIQRCALFVPVISRNTEDRKPRFLKREWNFALDRARDFLPEDPFIIPVVIDDTPESTARVPDRFLNQHWTRLPGGTVTNEFAAQLKRIVAEAEPSTPS